MGRRSGTTALHGPAASLVLVALAALLASCSSAVGLPTDGVHGPTVPELASDSVPVTTEPSPTTTWLPVEPCTVSELLVPSCGAWLGASTPSRDGRYDYELGLREYEAASENVPDIMHFYKKDAMVFPTAEEVALSERAGHQRSILLYNWKPSTTLSWRQVADGGADATIALIAEGLRQYDHRLFLAIWHEPENDQGVQGTPADYVAMYRHVVGQLRALGVTNVVYVMNYMGFAQWADVVDDFYPGDDVVDWIAYDPYGFPEHTDFAMVLNAATTTGWPGFYTWATTKAPDKPIMLGEFGIDLRRQRSAGEIMAGAVQILQSEFPQIKALVYWNDQMPDGVVVRLDEPSTRGTEYAAAYRRFAANPYFNDTDTALAP